MDCCLSHQQKPEGESGAALSPPMWLKGGTPQGGKLVPLLFFILVNRMTFNCIILSLGALSLIFGFIVLDISFASSRGMII